MSTESSANWITVASYMHDCFKVPSGRDKNNYFVIGSNKSGHGVLAKFEIHKYDVDADKWSKIVDIPVYNPDLLGISGALDTKKQTYDERFLTQIQLNDKQITSEHLSTTSDVNLNLRLCSSIIANTCLFTFGNEGNDSILKWDVQNKVITKFSEMYDKQWLRGFGLIYHNESNSILLFGGWNDNTLHYSDHILEFNITKRQWNKLNALPKPLAQSCCVMAIRKKYVLIFGGENGFDDDTVSDNIYIYSMKTKNVTTSKIRCSSKHLFEAITVYDDVEDKKIVFGYVRNQWKMCNINDHLFPANYLLLLDCVMSI
eukprot:493125_1